MGRSTLLLLAAMLTAALGTTLVWLYVQGADARARHDAAGVQVWVATTTIDEGTSGAKALRSARLLEVPRQVSAGAVKQNEQAKITQKQAVSTIPEGSPLYTASFRGDKDQQGLFRFDARNEVMTVSVPLPRRVAYLKAGMKVAVYVDAPGDRDQQQLPIARDVPVLDVGGELGAGRKPPLPSTPGPDDVSLEVTPAQLLKLKDALTNDQLLWLIIVGSAADLPRSQQ